MQAQLRRTTSTPADAARLRWSVIDRADVDKREGALASKYRCDADRCSLAMAAYIGARTDGHGANVQHDWSDLQRARLF